VEKLGRAFDRPPHYIINRFPVHADREGLRLETRPLTGRAGDDPHVLLDPLPNVIRFGLAVAAFEIRNDALKLAGEFTFAPAVAVLVTIGELLATGAGENDALCFFGKIAESRAKVKIEVGGDATEEETIPVGGVLAPRVNRTFEDR